MDQSLLYVEPLYLQAESGEIPELKRVILSSGEKVVMAETLAQSLAKLFGVEDIEAAAAAAPAAGPVVTGELPADLAEQVYDLARQADERYMAAQDALRAGDWAAYGTELDALEQILKQLVEITGPLAD
jgi:uncharacterized membrane protein (UPF0182 family)